MSFPHQLRGGTCDKCGPLQNVHPVSKGRICVVGSEDRLVLRNPSPRLRKGGTLRCPSFWRLGESRTLYKKSGNVCVPDLNVLPRNIKSSHNRSWTCIFSFHNQWCVWVEFLPWDVKSYFVLCVQSVPVLHGQFVQTVLL